MKKNILFCLFVSFFVLSFTGCVFVNVDLNEKYTMTFSNESSYNVSDWYLKDSDGNNKVKSHDDYNPVAQYSANSINNIPKGWYKVFFSFTNNPGKHDYWHSSSEVYLSKDKTYYLYNYGWNSVSDEFSRKAESKSKKEDDKTIDENNIITLIDNEGNIINFYKTDMLIDE